MSIHCEKHTNGEERDPLVAEAHEGGHHAGDARRVVDADLGLAVRVRREVDDRRAAIGKPPRKFRKSSASAAALS